MLNLKHNLICKRYTNKVYVEYNVVDYSCEITINKIEIHFQDVHIFGSIISFKQQECHYIECYWEIVLRRRILEELFRYFNLDMKVFITLKLDGFRAIGT